MEVGETLPPETRLLLDQLGVWDGFVHDRHEACLGSCSSWGSDVLGFNDFLLNPYGSGWHLDRGRFNALLRRSVAPCGITFLSGALLVGCQPEPAGGFQLHLMTRQRAPSTLSARYVIDATGVRSAFARRIGARRMMVDRLTFVYGFFGAGSRASASRLTMIEAEENGWWYAAGLPESRVAVAFATEPDIVRGFMLSVEERWLAHVSRTRYIAPRLHECRFERGSLAVRAAPSFVLDRVCGPRWLAVGDAAAAYDPLCSQGIYKALADGLEAAEVIAAALDADVDIASLYAASIAEGFNEYQAIRDYFYRIENRWADSPFWRRRIERSGPQGRALAA